MSNPQRFEVRFIEKDLVKVNFVDKELIEVELKCIDLLQATTLDKIKEFDVNNPQPEDIFIYEDGKWKNKSITEVMTKYHRDEEPVKVSSKRFETSQDIVNGTLQVFLNGIRETEIITISDNTFEFKIDTIPSDTVQVDYIKQI